MPKLRFRKFSESAMPALVLAVLVAGFTLAGCTVRKEEDGKKVTINSPLGELRANKQDGDKKVDIDTVVGSIHVGTQPNVSDTGLSLYPGAQPKPADGDDSHRANVNIGSANFGVRVVAAEFQSNDAPEKIIDFYRNDLKRYGKVLECPKGVKENHRHDQKELACSDSGREQPGKLDLAVGVPDRQRIVSVKPKGTGTEFALVYVQVRNRETM
ncbi:MAG TPA: hypothetical protein VEG30_01385 [Terriglobales bacterium]|nr:hypothetical protein [Terriglobales bacterium]